MKVAVVYNRESRNVINIFGTPNREKYGKRTIRAITEALRAGGHQVARFEADKLLIQNLEEFMPRVVSGERPGLVFNISYGIQGQARYTHVPSILEMVGIPYTGSGPMAHSLSLDKVVAKMIFRQHGLPTPDFAVLDAPDSPVPDLPYPLIVKPKDEAVSFGLRIVHDEDELRAGARAIFDKFDKPVLVEQFIEGREVNVALIGNDPPVPLPPVELIFNDGGPTVYTEQDKLRTSGREVEQRCPAELDEQLLERVREVSIGAFQALGCRDSARVDLRIDEAGEPYILEINSLASLGPGGSLIAAARTVGMDYAAVVNRLVDVASARYFGTPSPPMYQPGDASAKSVKAFSFLTQRRDRIERRLQEWCDVSSRTSDPGGNRRAVNEFERVMGEVGLSAVHDITDERSSWLWSTKRGFDNGTLLVTHVDVPLPPEAPRQPFRKDPEYLYGEGIGSSRAGLVAIEFALRALKSERLLARLPLGVLLYGDEGQDARYSERAISRAFQRAGRILVLRPQNAEGQSITQRRGTVKMILTATGRSLRLGHASKDRDTVSWLSSKMVEIAALNSRKKRLGVGVVDVIPSAHPMFLPHQLSATLLLSYYDERHLAAATRRIEAILDDDSRDIAWRLEEISKRPPMKERKLNRDLAERVGATATHWDIPFATTSSLWPSVAGLAPSTVPVLCGLGPAAENVYTPREATRRLSLIRQTLLLTQFLVEAGEVV